MGPFLCFPLPVLILFLPLCTLKNNFPHYKNEEILTRTKLIHSNLIHCQAFGGLWDFKIKKQMSQIYLMAWEKPFHIVLFIF